MGLVHSDRVNRHDPNAYLRDVLERPPTQPASRIGELLQHRWVNADAGDARRARVDEHV
jgi:transposase